MTADERRALLTAIFDRIIATRAGIERLEPSDDWRPYLTVAFPRPVRVPTERKTGLEPATSSLARTRSTN